VSTSNAVDKVSLKLILVRWELNGSHASILPGVFDCIVENNCFSVHICASVVVMGVADSWRCKVHRKDSFAVVKPVIMVQKLRPCWILGVWFLEPAEFGAILPCPCSDGASSVDNCFGEADGIIFINVSFLTSIDGKFFVIEFHRGSVIPCIVGKEVTHLNPATILNTHCENIGDIPHNITDVWNVCNVCKSLICNCVKSFKF
jgi:hypothetical protein